MLQQPSARILGTASFERRADSVLFRGAAAGALDHRDGIPGHAQSPSARPVLYAAAGWRSGAGHPGL